MVNEPFLEFKGSHGHALRFKMKPVRVRLAVELVSDKPLYFFNLIPKLADITKLAAFLQCVTIEF